MSSVDRFFALHVPGAPFVLANAWDAASARIYETAGFPAIATSSAAIAWTLGYADGERVDVDEFFTAIARIVRAVRVPVSADLEAGFGTTPDAIASTVERAISLGVVGANLEDYDAAAGDLYSIHDAVARIRAVRERSEALGVRFFINARCDALFRGRGAPESRVERTIERLRAYTAAGADGGFPVGLTDLATTERIARAIDVPLNVLVRPEFTSLEELGRCGVSRASIGSSPMTRTLAVLREIARDLRAGSFAYAREPIVSYADCNALFTEAVV